MSGSTGQELAITEVVARTSVGLNVEQTCASIRAGIARYDEHAYFDSVGADPEWDEPQPLVCATLPDIDPFLDYEDRLHAVARPLLSSLLAKMDIKRAELSRLGVLLALPEDDPPLQKWLLGREFLPALLRRSGIANVGAMAANQEGHTGIFSLLGTAAKLLESGQVDHCMVGGLDSYLLEDRMVYRDEAWRLRSERNVDGYIPGEAGALLLVETRTRAEARGAKILAVLGVQGSGQEPNPYAGERSSSGQGLKQALQAALAGGGTPPNWVVCDLNGESYRHFEWALMETKLPEVMSGLVRTVRPVESIGDVGAASGGILLACVCEAFARGYQPGPEALVWAAADDGKRIAMTVKQPASPSRAGNEP